MDISEIHDIVQHQYDAIVLKDFTLPSGGWVAYVETTWHAAKGEQEYRYVILSNRHKRMTEIDEKDIETLAACLSTIEEVG